MNAAALFAIAVAAATPSPSPSPSAPAYPCGAILTIVTRPTVTTDVCTAPEWKAVVETGYTNTSTTGAGGGQTIAYPQAFVRVGIGPRTELNITPPSYLRSSVGGPIIGGSSDMAMGAKWVFGYNDKAAWGANVQVSAATGTPGFTAGGTQYTGNINWAYTANSVWAVVGTVGFNSLVGTDAAGHYRSYGAFIPSVVVSATLPNNTELEAEYAYFSHAGPGLGPRSLIDMVFVRDLGEHVQFDIEYGFQPTVLNGQKLHYVGAGISFMN